MSTMSQDGTEIIVHRGAGSGAELTPEERAADEARDLMRPFDPGLPWEQGGRTLCEQTIRLNASMVAEGCVQIGRALIYAKGQVQHGEWGDWLDEHGISPSSAARMMRMAVRFANLPALANLTRTKAVALLGLSDDQLDELNSEGVTDTLKRDAIERMSARELQGEIKRLKAKNDKGLEQTEKLKERVEQLEDELDVARGLSPDADDRFLALVGRLTLDLEDFERLIRETKDEASATRVWAKMMRELRQIRDGNLDLIHLGALMASDANETQGDEEIVDELDRAEYLEARGGAA